MVMTLAVRWLLDEYVFKNEMLDNLLILPTLLQQRVVKGFIEDKDLYSVQWSHILVG